MEKCILIFFVLNQNCTQHLKLRWKLINKLSGDSFKKNMQDWQKFNFFYQQKILPFPKKNRNMEKKLWFAGFFVSPKNISGAWDDFCCYQYKSEKSVVFYMLAISHVVMWLTRVHFFHRFVFAFFRCFVAIILLKNRFIQ